VTGQSKTQEVATEHKEHYFYCESNFLTSLPDHVVKLDINLGKESDKIVDS